MAKCTQINIIVKKSEFGHYVNSSGQYYCSNLSELILYVEEGKDLLISRIANNLNLLFDQVLVDEFQDFRTYHYDLIISLSKHLKNVLYVGDYYQHSVSGRNNSGKPFKVGRKKDTISYENYIDLLEKEGFIVDQESLISSRRCSKEVCDFVSSKLGIKIQSSEINEGKVFWCKDNIEAILNDDEIVKLVISKAKNYKFRCLNWSYSKGDTFSEVCVILTQGFENLDDDEFTTEGISSITINKAYVAMTRSEGNLWLLKASEFKKVRGKYIIK